MRGSRTLALSPAFFSFVLASATVTSGASASERCGNPLASTCVNDDTLWPHAGPSRFLTVGGTETTARGQFGFGLFATYLSRPITLTLPSPGPPGSQAYAVDQQVNGTFLWSFGVTDRLELDAMLPVTFGQSGAGAQPVTGGASLQDTALRDLRFGAAYAVVPHARADAESQSTWGLVARFETSAPTGDEAQFAGERAAVFVPSVSGDARVGRFIAGAEVGARLRPVAELAGQRIGSQIVLGGGVGYDLLKRRELLVVTAEARALPTLSERHTLVQTSAGLQSGPSSGVIVPAEWAVSLRTAPIGYADFALQIGGGGSLLPDAPITTPRYRFSLAVQYAPLARDSDGDGVLDRDDRCPHQRGSRASGGCEPEAPPAPPAFEMRPGSPSCDADPESVDGFRDDACPDGDSDTDGIDDRRDKCPNEAEDFAGPQDGCPEHR